MQQYDALVESLKPLQKNVKDSAAATVSAQKKISRNVEAGKHQDVPWHGLRLEAAD